MISLGISSVPVALFVLSIGRTSLSSDATKTPVGKSSAGGKSGGRGGRGGRSAVDH